jgi:transposase
MHPAMQRAPTVAERREILRALANALGKGAPARVFPNGLPPVKAVGPHQRIQYVQAPR